MFSYIKDLPRINEIKSQSYQGDLGSQCKEFTRQYGHLLKLIFNDIKVKVSTYTESGERSITCSKGCGTCCYQFISVSVSHALFIADYLYASKKAMQVFLTGYDKWLGCFENNPKAVSVLDNLEEFTTKAAVVKHYSQELCTDYHKLDIQCPFLFNGQCSIYVVRPVVCATYFSLSPVNRCQADSDFQPLILQITPSEIYLRRMAELANHRWHMHQESLPKLVYKLLTQGLPEVAQQIDSIFDHRD